MSETSERMTDVDMTPDDVTQPMTPRPAPNAPWPSYDAPIVSPPRRPLARPRYPSRSRTALWGAGGFALGCVIAAVVALALLAPAPAPSVPAQTSAALTVTLTDTLLTQSLASNLGTSGGNLAQPHVHIQSNGQIVISGTLEGIVGSGSQVTIVAQPYVSQHTLAIRIVRAGVDGLALPPSMLDSVRDQINQSLARSSSISLGVGQTLVVSGVSFTSGAMTLTYAPAAA